jgi:hypothetical protein
VSVGTLGYCAEKLGLSRRHGDESMGTYRYKCIYICCVCPDDYERRDALFNFPRVKSTTEPLTGVRIAATNRGEALAALWAICALGVWFARPASSFCTALMRANLYRSICLIYLAISQSICIREVLTSTNCKPVKRVGG